MKNKIDNSNNSTRPKIKNEKDDKALTHASINEFLKGRHMLIKAFKSRIFPMTNICIDVNDNKPEKY